MALRLIVLLALITVAIAAPHAKNPFTLQSSNSDALVFQLGNISYVANTAHPKASFDIGSAPKLASSSSSSGYLPLTVISTEESLLSKTVLEESIQKYIEIDDVWSEDFLRAVLLDTVGASSCSMDASATNALASFGVEYTMLSNSISKDSSAPAISIESLNLTPGPYLAYFDGSSVSISAVYRLYTDWHRDFLYGTYETGDDAGSYTAFGLTLQSFRYPQIPVPSRLHYLHDTRPFAGFRVGIKDLYDMKGLITSGGSQAWEYISSPAEKTAPSIQRIIDLGGVLVGKQKLAQFASGADPWNWQDEHYPFNPRGDGWLTCSASSSGGGCSIAAYDWLDYAIGSDTGSSMRRPAAVAGVYGQRPSQGIISLENVLPLATAMDTAGVFARDPKAWVHFSKHWYTPDLFQNSSTTGLTTLSVPDNEKYPKRIIYPTDYLPLNNSDAEPILQAFIANMSSIFDMEVDRLNFTAVVQNSTLTDDLAGFYSNASYSDPYVYQTVAKPLIDTWATLFDGRFPPIDPARRDSYFNRSAWPTEDDFAEAQALKAEGVAWYEENFQYSTAESCSESIMVNDIGTGGLPSYREQELNNNPNASFLAVLPKGAAVTEASICPLFGCADFTIPIGQVPYYSEVTFREEMVPVTVSLIVKRGCDFMLVAQQ